MAKNLFTKDEQKRIEETVSRAEKSTSGEIAVMILDESDSYSEAVIFGTLMLSGLLSLIVPLILKRYEIWYYIPVVFILYLPVYYMILKVTFLKRLFASSDRMAEAVRERAVRAFYEKGLYRTRDETGILIFISLFERKVWILGDKGINAVIAHDTWNSLASELSAGMSEKNYCNSLVSVIEKCGAELTKHFPRKSDDRDELSNKIIY